EPQGAFVLPGKYKVTLTVDGSEYSRLLVVKSDPRIHIDHSVLKKQLDLELNIYAELKKGTEVYRKITEVLSEQKHRYAKTLLDSLTDISNNGRPNISSVCNVLSSLEASIEGADAAPTAGQLSVYEEYRNKLDSLLKRWEKLKKDMNR
ncbi:MAG: hypothetical protein ACPL1K_04615, partial [Candidatus Kryptoniota bacterium]